MRNQRLIGKFDHFYKSVITFVIGGEKQHNYIELMEKTPIFFHICVLGGKIDSPPLTIKDPQMDGFTNKNWKL